MNKIFNFLLAVILVACSQKKPSLIPQQNSAELTQIYILMGEDASCEFPFVSMLNVEEIQNELNARVIVQREKVPSIAKLR
jgi:outer membrane biosynthesis protein TonB